MSTPVEEPDDAAGSVWLVARREIAARLASKAFRIMTIGMMLAVVAFVLVLKLAASQTDDAFRASVGFTPSVASLAQPLVSVGETVGQSVDVSTVDQATGEQRVRDGTLDALVTGTPESLRVVVLEELPLGLDTAFSVLVRQVAFNQEIERLGGDPGSVSAAVDAASFDVRALELEAPRKFDVQRLVIGFVVGVLVYIALLVWGQLVAQGVVEEKSSRVVELLLTTIRPWQLMLGKVLGIGLLGLGQLVLIAAAGIAAGFATDTLTFPPGLAAGIVGWTIVWFLLGFLAYALIFAALGALVSRQEDVGGVTAPALMVIIIPYVLGISILPADPGNELIALLSLVPLFAPTLMPVRIAMGTAEAWEIAVSTTLTVGLVVLLVWLAGRIYGNAVLRMGSRIRLRDAFRSAS
jgi:ABC-2 type transport system permease protein